MFDIYHFQCMRHFVVRSDSMCQLISQIVRWITMKYILGRFNQHCVPFRERDGYQVLSSMQWIFFHPCQKFVGLCQTKFIYNNSGLCLCHNNTHIPSRVAPVLPRWLFLIPFLAIEFSLYKKIIHTHTHTHNTHILSCVMWDQVSRENIVLYLMDSPFTRSSHAVHFGVLNTQLRYQSVQNFIPIL